MEDPYFTFGIYEFIDWKTDRPINVEIIGWDDDIDSNVEVYKSGTKVLAVRVEGSWKYNVIVTGNNNSNEMMASEKYLQKLLAYTYATSYEQNHWQEEHIPKRLEELIKIKDYRNGVDMRSFLMYLKVICYIFNVFE